MSTREKPVALVTGAARRIGCAIAMRLAADGYDIVVHYRNSRDDALALKEEIQKGGGRAAALSAELSDAGACESLIKAANDALGPVALLINNASIFEPDAAGDFTAQGWDRHFNVNLRAPMILAREMAKALPMDCTGAIINILDQRVFKPTPHFFSYALTKSALHAATHAMALSFAPRIRVNAVAPGPTAANIRQSADDFQKQAAATLLGKPVSPDEIADAVLYLAQAKSVTGQTIAVDGGQRLAWETPDVLGIVE